MSEKKEIVMNGAGVAELGFPGWPQFDPKSKRKSPKHSTPARSATGPAIRAWNLRTSSPSGAAQRWQFPAPTARLRCTRASATLGIGPGDEVIVPSYSFIASSFAVVQAGCGAHLLRRG